MKTTRRKFLQATTASAAVGLPAISASGTTNKGLDGFEIAKRHKIVRDLPTPSFFEGMLLGNGDVGVCVTVRPDALGLHLGKLDAWDIRVSEDHAKHVVPFADLLKMWERASVEAKRQGKPDMPYLESNIDFFREYTQKVSSSYSKPWPRPCPCGLIWIHWDPRWVRLIRQTLDPSNGVLTIDLGWHKRGERPTPVRLTCFVDWETGLVSVSADGPAPFSSVVYYSNLGSKSFLMPPGVFYSGGNFPTRAVSDEFAGFKCRQDLPATAPKDGGLGAPPSRKDTNLAVQARLQGSWYFEILPETADIFLGKDQSWEETQPRVLMRSGKEQLFRLDLLILTPRDHPDNIRRVEREVERLSRIPASQLQSKSQESWRKFWSRSAVEFEDKELERIWYHNQYFLACCLREGKVCPGLFGNWTSGKIGTAWHGDYHMNYNTQQVFWGVFSSNHVDQHLPYVDLAENLYPMSEAYARDHFGLPGAFFPHSAYPVPSQVMPYPAPPWGYEVSETPWTVQSLWWHYLYTLDKEFLKRAYPLLRAAPRFLVAYVRKREDSKYHIIPTVSPENWGFTVDFRLNKDCILDLALSAFVLDATTEASRILQVDQEERERWTEVRRNLTPYPKVQGPSGEIWVDVLDAPAEVVYNIPVTLAPVFPGEQVGIGRGEEWLDLARRTANAVRLEGGNDLVYRPLILARLGMLDLDGFKREIRYCLLPNGVANDRVRQVGGRYDDSTDFDFMMRMGVWTENLSLPAVLNECMMQSWSSVIHLFPNTRGLGAARFQNLRAVGAFLVSANYNGKEISGVTLLSEKGSTARLADPWPGKRLGVTRTVDNSPVDVTARGAIFEFATTPGERYRIEPV